MTRSHRTHHAEMLHVTWRHRLILHSMRRYHRHRMQMYWRRGDLSRIAQLQKLRHYRHDSILDQRVHGPAKVRDDWDSYHNMRPIAQQRYEQAKRRCLELKGMNKFLQFIGYYFKFFSQIQIDSLFHSILCFAGTGRPPRRGHNATKETNIIPDINRRAVI